MKNTRKGLTLVEIIVAIAVFSIVSVAFFTSYVSMNKVVARQEEYVRFEMICYDINYYWDVYGKDGETSWDKMYFGSAITDNKGTYTAYFDKDFEPQNTNKPNSNSVYKITFCYTGEGNNKSLTIDKIEKIVKGDNKVIIEGVKCGPQGQKGDK